MLLGFRQMLHLYDVRHAPFPIIYCPNLRLLSKTEAKSETHSVHLTCRKSRAAMFCWLCDDITDVSSFYYCLCLIKDTFFFTNSLFFSSFCFLYRLTGRTSGWEFSEENDPDLWEKVIQKPGTENKVSRQSRKVSLFPLYSVTVGNLQNQTMECEINAKDIYY